MVRRLLLFVLSVVLCASPCLAVSRCIVDGSCAPDPSPPDFGTYGQPPIPPGSITGLPTFPLAQQEPYRNPDMGPLGVVLSTGEFQITVTDFEIPGRGFPFRLTRTYRSRKDGNRSVLGYNWQLNYDEYLTPGTVSNPGRIPRVMYMPNLRHRRIAKSNVMRVFFAGFLKRRSKHG